MITKVKDPVPLVLSFVWVGFVCAISFMESWLKFQAAGLTLPVALSVGKLVFAALNKVEWVLGIAILVVYLPSKLQMRTFDSTLYYILIPIIIVAVQTFYLLPQLSMRADLIIAGKSIQPSSLHVYYVGLEVVKIINLTVFGLKQFSKDL